MPSLERFFPPIARFFDTNVKSLPNSRLYFYRANSTTLKATFKDKVGEIAHANPVEADASGKFPPIFLSGLYRVELRSKDNIVQPGWPVDNVGQDSAIVPFAPWSEIVTYQTDDVVTSPDGFWFRSKGDDNLGLDPDTNSGPGGAWELIVIPIAANFTSSVPWATWSDSGTQLSLDIDENGLSDGIGLRILLDNTDDLHALPALDANGRVARYYWTNASVPANSPEGSGFAGFAERRYIGASVETITVYSGASQRGYIAAKSTTWGPWVLNVLGDRQVNSGRGLNGGGDLSANRTINTYRRLTQLTGSDTLLTSNFDGVFWYSSASSSHIISIGAQGTDEGGTETVLICREGSSFNLTIEALGTTIVWSFDESASADGYQIKPGEIVRLVKVATNSYVAYADNGISETVVLAGDFTSGSIKLKRVGDTIGISADGILLHSSGSTILSQNNAVPDLFLPDADTSFVYAMQTGVIREVRVVALDGQFSLSYRDYSGALSSETSSGRAPSISYLAE